MKSREPGIYRDPSATGRAEAAPESRGSNAALDPALSREEQVARRDDTGRDGALGCREPQSRIASAIARGCSCSESTAKSRLRVEALTSPARRPQRLWQKPITHPYLLAQSAARSTPAQGENHAMRERQF